MTARLMTPFCFASLALAALVAEGALTPYMPATPGPQMAAAEEPATLADLYTMDALNDDPEAR